MQGMNIVFHSHQNHDRDEKILLRENRASKLPEPNHLRRAFVALEAAKRMFSSPEGLLWTEYFERSILDCSKSC